MVKKFAGIRIDPITMKRLKMFAVKWDLPIGETIEGLLNFTESASKLKDPEFLDRFRNLLSQSMRKVGEFAPYLEEDDQEEPPVEELRGRYEEKKKQIEVDMAKEKKEFDE
ncbi:hypothetical protein [Solidesulfovibrio sp.]|uniref:hypothetical protein n=1 Tax=Solidesulfovibrio sp. TaxID=2910990 RepID=UPI002B2103E8|nr:hypothetical protein [Solidesulfovibrio sp.]